MPTVVSPPKHNAHRGFKKRYLLLKSSALNTRKAQRLAGLPAYQILSFLTLLMVVPITMPVSTAASVENPMIA